MGQIISKNIDFVFSDTGRLLGYQIAPGNQVMFPADLMGEGAPVDYAAAVAATKVYASSGANNNLTATAKVAGTAGNAYSVSCVQSEAISGALSVSYASGVVVITLPSDGDGVPVATTANQVKTAWDASGAVNAMTIAVEGSGAGTVAVFSNAPLLTGADVVPGTGSGVAGPGERYTDITNAKLYINGGTKAEPVWKIVTSA